MVSGFKDLTKHPTPRIRKNGFIFNDTSKRKATSLTVAYYSFFAISAILTPRMFQFIFVFLPHSLHYIMTLFLKRYKNLSGPQSRGLSLYPNILFSLSNKKLILHKELNFLLMPSNFLTTFQ